ncbi:hypothetical protein ABZ372_45330, partial [Streptomyces sp. NPDC005921]
MNGAAERSRLPFARPNVLDLAPLYEVLRRQAPITPVTTPRQALLTPHSDPRPATRCPFGPRNPHDHAE